MEVKAESKLEKELEAYAKLQQQNKLHKMEKLIKPKIMHNLLNNNNNSSP